MTKEKDQPASVASVAYTAALAMWRQSKDGDPKIEDQDEFLRLVRSCKSALN